MQTNTRRSDSSLTLIDACSSPLLSVISHYNTNFTTCMKVIAGYIFILCYSPKKKKKSSLPIHYHFIYNSSLCVAEMSWKISLKILLQGAGLPLGGRQSGDNRESCFPSSRPDAPMQQTGWRKRASNCVSSVTSAEPQLQRVLCIVWVCVYVCRRNLRGESSQFN